MKPRDIDRDEFNRQQGEMFDKVAQLFDELSVDVDGKLEDIVKSAQIKAGDAILDVGSGTGALIAPILKTMPSKVVACDLSLGMIKQAKAKYGPSVKYVHQDVIDLPGKEGPFDVVFCNAVFGNVYDQQLAVQAIQKLLKEGGRLVISHPLGKDFVKKLNEKRPWIKELPDKRKIRNLVESNGFKLILFIDDPDFYLAIAEKVS